MFGAKMVKQAVTTLYMAEAKRAPGSEWLKDHPHILEITYNVSKRLIELSYPVMKRLNAKLAERLMVWSEGVIKGWAFNCQMCGQCILHSTGMTCPMNCPKNLRNGPCGGVRPNGHCEVIPAMPCVWVQAWERSHFMPNYGHEIQFIQPPLNRRLQGSSAWINMVEGRDLETSSGWALAAKASAEHTSQKIRGPVA